MGAWYVTADIREHDEGPFAGRRGVVIKGNVAVAGNSASGRWS